MNLPESKLTKKQTRTIGPVPVRGNGYLTKRGALIKAEVRYDDECGNGHNTFAITGEIYIPGQPDCESCGCIHEEIAKHFPTLAPLIKWHGVSSDGPMHYPGNVLYHAEDRDFRGLRKGEQRQLRNGKTKQPVWKAVLVDVDGNEIDMADFSSKNRMVDADECPVSPYLRVVFKPYMIEGEGKARELAHARSSAVWPEATDEELTAPDLKEKLHARLPALMQEFKTAVESFGFTY